MGNPGPLRAGSKSAAQALWIHLRRNVRFGVGVIRVARQQTQVAVAEQMHVPQIDPTPRPQYSAHPRFHRKAAWQLRPGLPHARSHDRHDNFVRGAKPLAPSAKIAGTSWTERSSSGGRHRHRVDRGERRLLIRNHHVPERHRKARQTGNQREQNTTQPSLT